MLGSPKALPVGDVVEVDGGDVVCNATSVRVLESRVSSVGRLMRVSADRESRRVKRATPAEDLE